MNNSKKLDARTTTPKEVVIGSMVTFIKVPYFCEDLRLFNEVWTVSKIQPTKSGKRVRVYFIDEQGVQRYGHLMGFNSFFEQSPRKFWAGIIKERGVKDGHEVKAL